MVRRRGALPHQMSQVIILVVVCFLVLIPATSAADYKDFLSAKSQAVIQQLAELRFLPEPAWKFHPGDIPHGESVDLDDSSWETALGGSDRATGSTIPADQTTWYRAWFEIPKFHKGYGLTGCKVWFRFQRRGDGTAYQIVYFNGRRVALGEALEEIPLVLTDSAKTGEKILVAVKISVPKGANLRFARSPVQLEFAPSRPSPEDLRQEFISTASFIEAGLTSSVNADKTRLETAINAVDFTALDSADQAKFDSSLRVAQGQLESFKSVLHNYQFHLAGNSHIDSAWLWPWTETVNAVNKTFRTATQLMREYPGYTFTQSAAQHTAWIAEKYPELNDEIRSRVKEGRWEIVGGMWVEPDLNMPDGESLARQLLVGTRYFKSQYGSDVRIGWNPDSFGYNWQLPQIYKKSGIDYFITTKLTYNETHQMPFKLFWWESPDGSKVLTYFPRVYDSSDLSLERLSSDFVRAQTLAPGLPTLLDLYGVGDHGGGPTREILDEGMHWMQADKIAPVAKFGTVQPYFSAIEKRISDQSPVWDYKRIDDHVPPKEAPHGGIAIPTWKDELYFEFHRGVFTSQANHKRSMRQSEEWLLNSEKYASLAWLAGSNYPQTELTNAWKKALFNQFHDLAAGSGIGVLYKEAQEDYQQVRWATDEISSQALDTISKDVNTAVPSGVPVLVFNPLAWPRSGLVTVDVQMPAPSHGRVSVLDAESRVVPSRILSADETRNSYKLLLQVKDVPSMGYRVLRVVPGERRFDTDLKVNGFTLENSVLRVSVDRETGCITSIYNKKSTIEALQPSSCGNELQTFADNPKCCDAWNIDPGTLDHANILRKADSVEIVDNDPLRVAIRVSRSWQSSKFVQEIALYTGSDQVEVANDIDWHESHTLLKAAFPLAATSSYATYEIPFGTIERPTTRNNSWEATKFEVPAIRWADLGNERQGLSLLNESKYGYDAKLNVLRLSLLRSPKSPDPEADMGRHRFSFSLYLHSGDWKQALTIRRGYEYNYSLTAMQVQGHTGNLPAEHSFLSVEPESLVLTSMKKAEDSNALILRVFEWAGKEGTAEFSVPKGASSATITNLMEKPQGPEITVTSGPIRIPIHPFEILTLRVDYPRP
jgi:alpha-mannosidase